MQQIRLVVELEELFVGASRLEDGDEGWEEAGDGPRATQGLRQGVKQVPGSRDAG